MRPTDLHVEVEASAGNGLAATGYIPCELIRSVSRRRLVHQLGVLDLASSQRVHDITKVLLDH